MASILVLLVSDQTIPNFLFVKSFPNVDKYLFITTAKMENKDLGIKREWISISSGISENRQEKIIVDPELKEDVMSKLSLFSWESYDNIIVNITGGTKMMSIASYEFFKNRTDQIWYLPLGKNQYHLCDNSTIKKEVTYKMNVEEYLDCCGIFKKFDGYYEKEPVFDEEYVNKFYASYMNGLISYENLENIRVMFRSDKAPFAKEMNKRKRIDLNLIEDFEPINMFLKEINFPIEGGILTKEKMDFLTGGWFEEYTYYLFRKVTGLPALNFKIGAVLNPKAKAQDQVKYFTSNDLDIVFVNNNTLYVIECKSSGMEMTDLYNKTVYLGSALRKYFGLNVKSILCTLSEMNEDKVQKANTLGIEVLSRKLFLEDTIEIKIKELLK